MSENDGGFEPFMPLAEAALARIASDSVIGLGSGRAAIAFVHALAKRVHEGLRVRGVPTSLATAKLASKLGITLVTLDDAEMVDIAVDGADEVDPRGDMIKGRGGAHVREKIVALAARERLILVGAEKLVPVLGTRGLLPVEVVPFGLAFCSRAFERLGLANVPRRAGARLFLTDNGNHILDCKVSPLSDPPGVERAIREVAGVVATGLFLGMRPTVLVQEPDNTVRRIQCG